MPTISPELVAHLVGTIEFNFRDAKQYWGLEDFMHTSPTAVENAANLSLFMVNLVERVLQEARQRQPECSVLDLKAHYRGCKYVEETIKLLPERPEPILVERIFRQAGWDWSYSCSTRSPHPDIIGEGIAFAYRFKFLLCND
jgi:hypothetical protein